VSERRALDLEAIRWDDNGLVPAIAQSAEDGRVLMLAWQDREALGATLATGEVHFHSRSRDALWRKGETSGNVLRLVRAELDCDADAVLLTVDPLGPTCHTGSRSCFDVGQSTSTRVPSAQSMASVQGFAWLETLWATIEERSQSRPEGSYTSRLLAGGVDACARKVAEEAVEVVMAAKDDAAVGDSATRSALDGELADLLYHALVLMAERRLPPSEVIEVLRSRHERANP
jgi:phosphoribosyl-AMP cyclohydrolase / phosphoribosyl-ATP pyrophosphohydrolase